MAISSTSPTRLREMARGAYSAAAEQPNRNTPFLLAGSSRRASAIPQSCLPACLAWLAMLLLASNVSLFAEIQSGATVLDLGCGSGTDTLIAARKVGPTGKVLGVDFSGAMLSRVRQAVAESGAVNVEFGESDAERLPIGDVTIDVAIVNGIFNLNPARDTIFQELARVVRPGGTVYAAELILSQPLPAEVRASEADWFA
jgi:arsenite methyltransferase